MFLNSIFAAYFIDPGFAGMLIPALIAAVAVGGAVLYSFRKKIRNLFSKNKDETPVVKKESNNSEDDVVDILSDKD